MIRAYQEVITFIKAKKTNTRTKICSAIGSKKVIKFYYHGGLHLVEPFCYGVDRGHEGVLRCYQVSGHSEFGDSVGWKLYRASEITGLEITNEHFTEVRPEYDTDDLDMATIYCCVSMDTDNESQPKIVMKLEESRERESLSYDNQAKYTAPAQTHNDHMRRFRLSHFIFPSKAKH